MSSWDCSRSEEKAQEVQAAKAARGRARQQRADKHISRLASQKEKAALTLAALQSRHPSPESREAAEACENGQDSIVSGATHEAVLAGVAADAADKPQGITTSAFTEIECSGPLASASIYDSCQQQHNSYKVHSRAADLAHVHSLPLPSSSHMACSQPPADPEETATQTHSHTMSAAKDIPLRRYASAAGSPTVTRVVPSPLLPSCASECRQHSPNSMTSWQIVRPRPVQHDRSKFKASTQVHVHA